MIRTLVVHDETFEISNKSWDTHHDVRVRNYALLFYNADVHDNKPSASQVVSVIDSDLSNETVGLGQNWYIQASRYARVLVRPREPARYIVRCKTRGGEFQFEVVYRIKTDRLLLDPTVKTLTEATLRWLEQLPSKDAV